MNSSAYLSTMLILIMPTLGQCSITYWQKLIAPRTLADYVTQWTQKNIIGRPLPQQDLYTLSQTYLSAPRNSQGYHTLTAHSGDRIIVIGNIGNDARALLHICQALVSQHILTDNLTLTSAHDHIIFLGYFIGNKLNQHEDTLSLIVTLAQKNPLHVWICPYASGCEQWNNDERIYSGCTQLPTGIFITIPDDSSVARILFAPIPVFAYDAHTPLIVITTPDGNAPQLHTDGLLRTCEQGGISTWSVLSSPQEQYTRVYDNKSEAYGIIEVGTDKKQSTITWYTNLTDIDHVKKQEWPLGFDLQHTLLWGGTCDLSRSDRVDGQGATTGFLLRSYEFTDDTEHPYKIRYIAYDDQYDTRKTQKWLDRLCTVDNVSCLAMVGGTAPLRSILSGIAKYKKFLFFPGSGAGEFRKKNLTQLIHSHASYTDEIIALLGYIITKKQSKTIACFYQSNSFGPEMLATAQKICAQHKDITLIPIAYNPTSIDMTGPITQFKQSNADTLLIFATTFAIRAFINQIDISLLYSVVCAATSGFWEPAFREFLLTKGLSMVSSQIVPDPRNSTLPIVARYQKAMDSRKAPYSAQSLEGYINAHILIDLIHHQPKALWNKPELASILMTQAEKLQKYNCDGLELTFDPAERTLSHTVWISDGDDPWQRSS